MNSKALEYCLNLSGFNSLTLHTACVYTNFLKEARCESPTVWPRYTHWDNYFTRGSPEKQGKKRDGMPASTPGTGLKGGIRSLSKQGI